MTNSTRFAFLFAFAALSSQAAINAVDARSGVAYSIDAAVDPLYRLNAYHASEACFTGSLDEAVKTVNAMADNEGISFVVVDDMGGTFGNLLLVEPVGGLLRLKAVIHDEYGGYEIDRAIPACR